MFGGATLAKQPADGEAPDMTGSCMLIKANSEEDVKALISADEYAKGLTAHGFALFAAITGKGV